MIKKGSLLLRTGVSKVKAKIPTYYFLDTSKYNTIPYDITQLKSRDIEDDIITESHSMSDIEMLMSAEHWYVNIQSEKYPRTQLNKH